MPHRAMRAGQQRGIGRTGYKKVGVRKEPAFGLRTDRADRAHQLGVGKIEHGLGDVLFRAQSLAQIAQRPAFHDGEARLRDVALRELCKQSAQRRARGNLVIARFDHAVDTFEATQRNQRPVRAQHAGTGEIVGNGAQRRTGAHRELEGLLRQRQRLPRNPPERRRAGDERENQQGRQTSQHEEETA